MSLPKEPDRHTTSCHGARVRDDQRKTSGTGAVKYSGEHLHHGPDHTEMDISFFVSGLSPNYWTVTECCSFATTSSGTSFGLTETFAHMNCTAAADPSAN
jgi:hypothetical protein